MYDARGHFVQSESSSTLSHPLNGLGGQVLGGRYELGDVLGRGGMATVYRARDRRLGRTVAVKVLHAHHAGDDSFVHRFHREAEFAASLGGHPHIVEIYDVGSDSEVHYIVMKLVEGGTLKELIRHEGPLPERQALDIGRQVAAALAFAHQHGLIHRDIKPQNVLVTPAGHVEVTDFGIARRDETTQITSPDMMLGTAQYVSPEQAQGQTPGPAADIYSLGVVLFEMVTGRLPFRADTPLALAMQHVETPPPAAEALNPALSPETSALIRRALAKDPAARFRDAAEMAGALQQRQSGDAALPADRPLADAAAPPLVPAPPARSSLSPRWLLLPALGAVLALAAWLAPGAGLDPHRAAPATSAVPRRTAHPALGPPPSPATATPTTIPSPTLPPATATSQPVVIPLKPPTETPTPSPTAAPPTPTATPTSTPAASPTAAATPAATPLPPEQPPGPPQPGSDSRPPVPAGPGGPPGDTQPPPGQGHSSHGHDHGGQGGDQGSGGHGDHG